MVAVALAFLAAEEFIPRIWNMFNTKKVVKTANPSVAAAR